jgi:anti-sigma regulatory factor (Ser/Thr protein kinase)
MVRTPDIATTVRSEPRLLQAVRGLVRSYVRSQGFNSDTVDDIVLAVDEACTNAIRHAYNGDTCRNISLYLSEEDGSLVIEVRDDGKPAPREKFNQRVECPPDDPMQITPGGLGIPLMHAVFDSVEFDCGETSGNRVRLRLKRPEETA